MSYTIEQIQRIILDGADIREASYVRLPNIEIDGKTYHNGKYTKTIIASCIEAANGDPIGYILGLALDGWWNDALNWAEKPHKGKA